MDVLHVSPLASCHSTTSVTLICCPLTCATIRQALLSSVALVYATVRQALLASIALTCADAVLGVQAEGAVGLSDAHICAASDLLQQMLMDKDNDVRRIAVQSLLPALLSTMRSRPALAPDFAARLIQHVFAMDQSGHAGAFYRLLQVHLICAPFRSTVQVNCNRSTVQVNLVCAPFGSGHLGAAL